MDKLDKTANDFHRITRCGLYPIAGRPHVEVFQSVEHGTAHYGGLQQCGSVWACPVCASKIAERRREEIAQGFEYAYGVGGKKIIMVTLTFPHGLGDDLKTLLYRQSLALKKLREGDPWRRIKRRAGFAGSICSLEITYGQSGWHPHTHEAWIVDADTDAEALRERVSQRWAKKCRTVGLLKPGSENEANFARYAVDITDWAQSSDYLEKHDDYEDRWGVDRELASGVSKTPAGKHPFMLLEEAEDDERAGQLYLDYVEATKGKQQIRWSNGFKAAAGVGDRDDDEVVEEQEDDAVCVLQMDHDHWGQVIEEEAQSDILDLIEDEGYPGVARWFVDRGYRRPHMPAPTPPESPP